MPNCNKLLRSFSGFWEEGIGEILSAADESDFNLAYICSSFIVSKLPMTNLKMVAVLKYNTFTFVRPEVIIYIGIMPEVHLVIDMNN